MCVIWKAREKLVETLEIDDEVDRVVIYLKCGSLSGSWYHFGNFDHFTKSSPTLNVLQIPLIPFYCGNKNIVSLEQVFGKSQKTSPIETPSTFDGSNSNLPYDVPFHPWSLGIVKKPLLYAGAATHIPVKIEGIKGNVPQTRTSIDFGDKGKQTMDNEGYTPDTNKSEAKKNL